MVGRIILDVNQAKQSANTGRKAENLRFLVRRKLPVPRTLICTWDAYLQYRAGDAQIIERVRSELLERLASDRCYAVRSSADVEDDFLHSFAGQFDSVLNVRGVNAILEAVQAVWDSARSPKVTAYLERTGTNQHDPKMAVIIQEMVTPVVSGVSFSKNPLTGLDEIIVEAIRGSGEILMQEGVTPSRWVYKWGAWKEKPEQADIPIGLIQDVVNRTKRIASSYGRAIDLEWVFDGSCVYWVQLREIASLDIPLYSNRIAREVFPGIIKPLIWSVNVPLVNGAWVRLITELIGPNDIDPHNLARSFYYRAYFNMGAIGQILERLGLPRETLELLIGIENAGPERPSFKPTCKTFPLLPRMLRAAIGKLGFGRQIEAFLPRAEVQFKSFDREHIHLLGEKELLQEIDRLFGLVQEAAYYDIVTPLLMLVYNRILKRQLERNGLAFEDLDLTVGSRDLEEFAPQAHLAHLNQQYMRLHEESQKRVRRSNYAEFRQLPGIEPLQQAVGEFTERFGHLSDSGNDFSSVPWRETPDLILKMMVDYALPDEAATHRMRFEELDVSPPHRLLLRPFFVRACAFQWYREAVSSLYTLGYGLFRDYFLALGDQFARHGILAARGDIFYLTYDQVRRIAQDGGAGKQAQSTVAGRKADIERVQSVTLPSVIFGDEAIPLEATSKTCLKGIPTSRGQYTGPVKVVHGLGDFHKLQEGDVLVIPYSDVSWTPLFAKAGAVVAEAGGILSHSSIVAREYAIPAVVSVLGACQIADETIVTVNGFLGQVAVSDFGDQSRGSSAGPD